MAGAFLASTSAGPISAQTDTSPHFPLLSAAGARAVAMSFWGRWQSALSRADVTAIRQMTVAGPVQDDFLLGCTYKHYAFFEPCTAEPFLGLSVVVPIETEYPLYFLAEFHTRSQFVKNYELDTSYLGGALDLDVLVKAGPDAPWRLSFGGGEGSSNLTPPPFLGATTMTHAGAEDGLDVPSLTILHGAADAVPNLLAAYYQSWRDAGAAPAHTPVLSGPFTSTIGEVLATDGPQGAVSDGTRWSAYWKAEMATTGVWAFPVKLSNTQHLFGANPYLMECFPMEVESIGTPGPGEKVLVQRGSQIDFGPGLAPGIYSRVVQWTLHYPCVATDGKHYAVYGYGQGDVYADSGSLVTATGQRPGRRHVALPGVKGGTGHL